MDTPPTYDPTTASSSEGTLHRSRNTTHLVSPRTLKSDGRRRGRWGRKSLHFWILQLSTHASSILGTIDRTFQLGWPTKAVATARPMKYRTLAKHSTAAKVEGVQIRGRPVSTHGTKLRFRALGLRERHEVIRELWCFSVAACVSFVVLRGYIFVLLAVSEAHANAETFCVCRIYTIWSAAKLC